MQTRPSELHRVARISLDETETWTLIDGSITLQHLLMLHADFLHRASDNKLTTCSLAQPPAIIADQSAECVLAVLDNQISSIMWSGLCSKPAVSIFVLCSDSHAALIRLGKHMAGEAHRSAELLSAQAHAAGDAGVLQLALSRPGSLKLFLHGRCSMHLYFAALSAMVKGLGLLSPMFCGMCLLHKGQNHSRLCALVEKQVSSKLSLTYSPSSPEEHAHNLQLLILLDEVDGFQARECNHEDWMDNFSIRRDARRRLLETCAKSSASWYLGAVSLCLRSAIHVGGLRFGSAVSWRFAVLRSTCPDAFGLRFVSAVLSLMLRSERVLLLLCKIAAI